MQTRPPTPRPNPATVADVRVELCLNPGNELSTAWLEAPGERARTIDPATIARLDELARTTAEAEGRREPGAILVARRELGGALFEVLDGPERALSRRLEQAALDGDAGAAEELFGRYRGKLIAYARRVGCPNDAEDFVQIAFVALLSTAALTLHFNVRAYLFTVVRNRIIKQIARDAREPGLDESATLADEAAHDQLDRLILQHDLERAAERIEARCNPAEQAVLALTHAERSAAEIAAALEITAGNVRVIRHRALAKLRAAFNEDPS